MREALGIGRTESCTCQNLLKWPRHRSFSNQGHIGWWPGEQRPSGGKKLGVGFVAVLDYPQVGVNATARQTMARSVTLGVFVGIQTSGEGYRATPCSSVGTFTQTMSGSSPFRAATGPMPAWDAPEVFPVLDVAMNRSV